MSFVCLRKRWIKKVFVSILDFPANKQTGRREVTKAVGNEFLLLLQLVLRCQIAGNVRLVAGDGLTVLVNSGLVRSVGGGGNSASLGDGVAGGLLDGVGVAGDDGDLDSRRRRGQGGCGQEADTICGEPSVPKGAGRLVAEPGAVMDGKTMIAEGNQPALEIEMGIGDGGGDGALVEPVGGGGKRSIGQQAFVFECVAPAFEDGAPFALEFLGVGHNDLDGWDGYGLFVQGLPSVVEQILGKPWMATALSPNGIDYHCGEIGAAGNEVIIARAGEGQEKVTL